ncbi:unnamed protein product, partial [Ectocarpus sp. 12 AP-2014]
PLPPAPWQEDENKNTDNQGTLTKQRHRTPMFQIYHCHPPRTSASPLYTPGPFSSATITRSPPTALPLSLYIRPSRRRESVSRWVRYAARGGQAFIRWMLNGGLSAPQTTLRVFTYAKQSFFPRQKREHTVFQVSRTARLSPPNP